MPGCREKRVHCLHSLQMKLIVAFEENGNGFALIFTKFVYKQRGEYYNGKSYPLHLPFEFRMTFI